MPSRNVLTSNVQRYMKANGLTQNGASEAFGLKQYAIRDILRHPERKTRQETISQIASVMGVSADDLAGKRIAFGGENGADGVGRKRKGRKPGPKPGPKKSGRKLRVGRTPRATNGNATANGALIDLALQICGYELPDSDGMTAGERIAEAVEAVSVQVEKIAAARR